MRFGYCDATNDLAHISKFEHDKCIEQRRWLWNRSDTHERDPNTPVVIWDTTSRDTVQCEATALAQLCRWYPSSTQTMVQLLYMHPELWSRAQGVFFPQSQPSPPHPMPTLQRKHLFVGNLAKGITEDQLRSYFFAFGEIISVTTREKAFNGRCFVYGLVRFANSWSADTALNTMQGFPIKGRPIRTAWGEQEEAPQPIQLRPEANPFIPSTLADQISEVATGLPIPSSQAGQDPESKMEVHLPYEYPVIGRWRSQSL